MVAGARYGRGRVGISCDFRRCRLSLDSSFESSTKLSAEVPRDIVERTIRMKISRTPACLVALSAALWGCGKSDPAGAANSTAATAQAQATAPAAAPAPASAAAAAAP